MEHTPGPWEYDDRHYWIDGKRYGMDSWAIMRGSYCLATTDKNKANARLIAAAPDLLQALRNLVDIQERDERGDPDYLATDEWREEALMIAKSAIAKADEES
jgi:hypothetical protein